MRIIRIYIPIQPGEGVRGASIIFEWQLIIIYNIFLIDLDGTFIRTLVENFSLKIIKNNLKLSLKKVVKYHFKILADELSINTHTHMNSAHKIMMRSLNGMLLSFLERANKKYNRDAWGRHKVSQDNSILHGMFTYNVPEEKWYEMIDDVEQTTFSSAQSVDGKLVLSASGTQDEKRQLRTFRHPRYEPNRGHLYSNSAFFPNKNAQAERSFGIFTSEAGTGFRLRNGVLYAFRRTTVGGVTTDTEQVISVPSHIDLEKGNVYDIQFQWRGVGNYYFFIDLELVATIEILGTLDELSIFNPALPIAFECINKGESADIVCGCVDVSAEGGEDNGKTYGSLGTATNSGSIAISGFNQPVLAVRNKKLFDGKLNTRDVLSLLATAYGDQKCVFRVWITRDNTAITENDQTWQDYRDGHIEYIEYNNPGVATPMTFDETKATLVFGSRVNQDDSYSTSALFEGRTDIYQTPGDTLVFTMHRETGGAANVGVSYEFAEAI